MFTIWCKTTPDYDTINLTQYTGTNKEKEKQIYINKLCKSRIEISFLTFQTISTTNNLT